MTFFQIEVRAIYAQHDTHAHKLAREIIQLSAQQIPSLAEISAASSPLSIRTAQLYHLSGDLSSSQLEQLTRQLLVDPVVQEVSSGSIADDAATGHIVDVFFHHGVTDTLAESVITGARMLGITALDRVETGQRYVLDRRLSESEAHTIARSLLCNSVIQHYAFYKADFVGTDEEATETLANDQISRGSPLRGPISTNANGPISTNINIPISTFPLSTMIDEQLMEVSRAGLLSLNLDEMRTIQHHYQQQGREPTDVELETLAQTWSEHCSHKTFKALISYREIDSSGNTLASETIPGLLKHYIMRATEQVRPSWLVSAFSDNAGIIRYTDQYDLAFKVETHNHPSAIEPFGGANTGVGGVIRDVLGVSARPVACTDILCFGPLETPAEELPSGVLSPRRIASGVVSGVRDYGNKMGIPTVNGAVLYHSGYIYNPLVFCGCLGILPHGSHPNDVQPGDHIVVLGGRTGRDGVHGATFSSGEMSSEINAQAGTAVQIGAPITEKKVADVIMQARDRKLYHAITDCGAGGFSSAIGEMGANTGAHIELTHAPLKYQGLAPWEIWLSEAQERMVLAVPAQNLEQLLELCTIEEVEASIIGTFTDDHRLVVTYSDQVVATMDMEFLHSGCPRRTLDAVWTAERHVGVATVPQQNLQNITRSLSPTLLSLLRHPTLASKENIVRRYDHEVQGATVLKPLVGKAGNGPGDAAVLQPIIDEQTQAGIILSNGVNPLYGKIDPYHMAVNAVDEALRNLTAVGGDITHAAILDNFCWGNSTDPQQLGMLVRAVKGCYDAVLGFGTPFISGKDSLNNEYRANGERLPVIPTLVISAVGRIDDAAQTVDMSLKTPGNLLYLVGTTRNELAGSYYGEIVDQGSFAMLLPYSTVPQVDIPHAYTTMKTLGEAIRQGLVRACHDLSEGGLALSVAEMSLASLQGVTLDLRHISIAKHPPQPPFDGNKEEEDEPDVFPAAVDIVRLFSESPSRFLVEIAPEQLGTFEKYMRVNGIEDIIYVGTVSHTDRFIVRDGEEELINLGVSELQEAWKGGNS